MMAREWSLGSLASFSRSCWSGETGWCLDSPTSCHRLAAITTPIYATGSSAAFGHRSGLLVYLAARRNLADSVISFVAGLLAVGVALFPTNGPGTVPTIIAKLHAAFAALRFALLGVTCFRFGNREGNARGSYDALAQLVAVGPAGLLDRDLGRRCRQCGPRRSRVCRQQGRVLGRSDRGARLWILLVSEGRRALQHLANRARTAAGAQGTRPERARAVTKQAPPIDPGKLS